MSQEVFDGRGFDLVDWSTKGEYVIGTPLVAVLGADKIYTGLNIQIKLPNYPVASLVGDIGKVESALLTAIKLVHRAWSSDLEEQARAADCAAMMHL